MKIAILKETISTEHRVAASPETVKKLVGLGFSVFLEKSAGLAASIPDQQYEEVGAHIVKSRSDLLEGSQVILKVRSPLTEETELKDFPKGSLLICLCDILQHPKHLKAYEKHGLSVLALEMIPRITRAQAMDVLSSQSNLSGYRAVLEAATLFQRIFPMMMTAAGTLLPAKVFIIGAGVAGLQAIATAKRLGAVVSAYDVRPATKEQVESLGGTFVEVAVRGPTETTSGYAKEMTDDYKKQEKEKLAEVVKQADIVITTALIPGRPAPLLITEDMVHSMKSGSVVIDLAGENGGNCALSKFGKVVDVNGVKIYAPQDLVSKLARDATDLYARNIFNLMKLLYNETEKKVHLPLDDDIIKGALLVKEGEILRTDLMKE
ncbi:MAG: Re/Si-specific NAD(P)(+) transhydrogenase subunit alpha [Alphaproteobacteria bacterium]